MTRRSVLLLLAVFAALSIFLPTTSAADTVAQVPPWVVKAGSSVLGFFISDLGGDIVFGITDPVDGNTVPVQIRRSGSLPPPGLDFEGNEARVFYSGPDCTGTVWLNAPDSSNVRARTALLGTSYGVGASPTNSAIRQVFKGTGVSFAGDPGITSTFINGACGANVNGDRFQTATAIHTIPAGPYTME